MNKISSIIIPFLKEMSKVLCLSLIAGACNKPNDSSSSGSTNNPSSNNPSATNPCPNSNPNLNSLNTNSKKITDFIENMLTRDESIIPIFNVQNLKTLNGITINDDLFNIVCEYCENNNIDIIDFDKIEKDFDKNLSNSFNTFLKKNQKFNKLFMKVVADLTNAKASGPTDTTRYFCIFDDYDEYKNLFTLNMQNENEIETAINNLNNLSPGSEERRSRYIFNKISIDYLCQINQLSNNNLIESYKKDIYGEIQESLLFKTINNGFVALSEFEFEYKFSQENYKINRIAYLNEDNYMCILNYDTINLKKNFLEKAISYARRNKKKIRFNLKDIVALNSSAFKISYPDADISKKDENDIKTIIFDEKNNDVIVLEYEFNLSDNASNTFIDANKKLNYELFLYHTEISENMKILNCKESESIPNKFFISYIYSKDANEELDSIKELRAKLSNDIQKKVWIIPFNTPRLANSDVAKIGNWINLATLPDPGMRLGGN